MQARLPTLVLGVSHDRQPPKFSHRHCSPNFERPICACSSSENEVNSLTVIPRFGKILVIISLVLTTGFHWTAFQAFAWATMLANNLRTQSVTEAFSETFDGKHPCPLCKAIAAGKKSEKKSESVSTTFKFEYLPPGDQLALFSPDRFPVYSQSNLFAKATFPRPPVPPPRSIVG